MPRQVRIEGDALTHLEELHERWGGSLSGAANRIVLEHRHDRQDRVAQDAPRPVVQAPERAVPDVRPRGAVTVVRPTRGRRVRPRASRQPVEIARPGHCPHPILSRRGNECGACGATVR